MYLLQPVVREHILSLVSLHPAIDTEEERHDHDQEARKESALRHRPSWQRDPELEALVTIWIAILGVVACRDGRREHRVGLHHRLKARLSNVCSLERQHVARGSQLEASGCSLVSNRRWLVRWWCCRFGSSVSRRRSYRGGSGVPSYDRRRGWSL